MLKTLKKPKFFSKNIRGNTMFELVLTKLKKLKRTYQKYF